MVYIFIYNGILYYQKNVGISGDSGNRNEGNMELETMGWISLIPEER